MALPIASLPPLLVHLGTLAKVIPWGLTQHPQWIVFDVVIQGEYTHDVLLCADGVPQMLGNCWRFKEL
jgi:hypothetical protein